MPKSEWLKKKLFHFKLCSSEKRFDIALSERIETARVESSIRIEVGKAEKKVFLIISPKWTFKKLNSLDIFQGNILLLRHIEL